MKFFFSFWKIVFDIPLPGCINMFWNFGSLIGFYMFFQVFTGWILSMHYVAEWSLAYEGYKKLSQEIFMGWMVQLFHMNFASLIFLFVFMHIFKAILYGSFMKLKVWFSGIFMFFLLMISAFVGYVLPWGQMSFWGATVITNIFSAVPYIGLFLVQWLWGGYSVGNDTLNRFFSFHFFFPFFILMLIFFHLLFLHDSGSSNQLGVFSSKDKVNFDKLFLSKDFLSLFLTFLFYLLVLFFFCFSHYSMSKENFCEVDPLVTPLHIKPEWYFMFAYSILRCVPSKIWGIVFLFFVLFLFVILPFKGFVGGMKFSFLKKLIVVLFFVNFLFLSSMGFKEIENPYVFLTRISSFFFIFSVVCF